MTDNRHAPLQISHPKCVSLSFRQIITAKERASTECVIESDIRPANRASNARRNDGIMQPTAHPIRWPLRIRERTINALCAGLAVQIHCSTRIGGVDLESAFGVPVRC